MRALFGQIVTLPQQKVIRLDISVRNRRTLRVQVNHTFGDLLEHVDLVFPAPGRNGSHLLTFVRMSKLDIAVRVNSA